jgi:hypothetical protein
MLSRRSRYTVTTLLITVPLVLAACAGRSPTPQPSSPILQAGSWGKWTRRRRRRLRRARPPW